MKCSYCTYEWQYNGISVKAQCPRCRKFTEVPEIRKHLEAQAAKIAKEYKKQKKKGY